MNIQENVSIHNRFLIEVRDAKTGEITKIGKAENIVLENWGFGSTPSGIQFGSGTDKEKQKPDMKNLIELIGGADLILTSKDIKGDVLIFNYQSKTQIQANEYVGKVFAEVGLRISGYSNTLISHAFITDSEGNPLTITKKDTDVITLYATVYVKNSSVRFRTKHMGIAEWILTSSQSLFSNDSTSGAHGRRIIEIDEKRRKKGFFQVSNTAWNGEEIRVVAFESYVLSGDSGAANHILHFPEAGLFEGTQITKERLTGEKNGTNKQFNLKWSDIENLKLYKNSQLLQENTDYTLNNHVKKGQNLMKRLQSFETNSEVVFSEDYIDQFNRSNVDERVVPMAYKRLLLSLLKSERKGELRYLGRTHIKNLSEYIVTFKEPQKVDSFELDYSNPDWTTREGNYNNIEISLFDNGEWKIIYTGSANSFSKRNVSQAMNNVTKARVKLTNPASTWEWKKMPFLYLYQETIDMITFTNPPLADDVLEADYFVDYLAKDENHVINIHFDATLSPGAGE